MSFILKLFFTGLMVFIPNEDGTEVNVLLLNVDHNYHSSDNTSLDHHKPLLIARAGDCTGQCPKRDAAIAEFIYADKTQSNALDSLEAAVAGGGAWQLAGSQLSLQKGSSNAPNLPGLTIRDDARASVNGQPQIIPTTSDEREDFSWIAGLKKVCPDCTLNEDVLAEEPPGLVAARFRLTSGKVFTYAIERTGSNVKPVHFARLDGQGSPSSYSQAVATWVGAEIAIEGENVKIVEEKFDNSTGRSMTLSPDSNGIVEVAVLNLPPFAPSSGPSTTPLDPGKHFEMFYEVTGTPPAQSARLVPKEGPLTGAPAYAEVGWQSIHPQTELWSDLLNALRLNVGRSITDLILCPPSTWP